MKELNECQASFYKKKREESTQIKKKKTQAEEMS